MYNKFILLFTAVIIYSGLLAQDKKPVSDTMEITVKKIRTNKKDSIIIESNGQWWRKSGKRPNIETGIFNLDFGFSNYTNNTNYASAGTQAFAPGSTDNWFDLNNGKSINVNIWFFTQRINLIKHVVNLKYSLGLQLNNYRYTQPIRYNAHPVPANPAVITYDNSTSRIYKKNKLAADYVTVPVMLNFNLTPHSKYNFGFSAGVSAGYLYAPRNKVVTSDEGKLKEKGGFGLNPWKISYIGELNLGIVSLYGSVATKSMYKRGLDITPYEIGIRLLSFDDHTINFKKNRK